jgi:hypothetical protein
MPMALDMISDRSAANDRSEMTVDAPAGARMALSERSRVGWRDQVDTMGVRSRSETRGVDLIM